MIVVLTIYSCYKTVLYMVIPLLGLNDYSLLIFTASEYCADFILVTGLMIIFNPCFYRTEFLLSIFDNTADDVFYIFFIKIQSKLKAF